MKEQEFEKNTNDNKAASRARIIIRTSIIGIAANIFLAVFKLIIGLMSNSIAILLDAVNNASDVSSSIITIIGTKLAGREPDKKHPFGHGRIEYLSAMVIAVLVLYAGLSSLTASVKRIISPEAQVYTAPSLVIISVAVVVKLILGSYVKSVGRRVGSDSLINSGEDAGLDAIISAATLLAAVIYLGADISLEAWLGAVISLFIIKSGLSMLAETVSRLLGERGDSGLAADIKATVEGFDDVLGAYDLIINNYGPGTFIGSICIEVPDTYSADSLDQLIRKIKSEVNTKHNVIFTAVGVYSVNTTDPEAVAIRAAVEELILSQEYVLQMHGFFVNIKERSMRCDVVISFDAPSRISAYKTVVDSLQAAFPDYTLEILMDTDFAEF